MSNIVTLLLVGVGALAFIVMISAPFETLGWWAGWFGEDMGSLDQVMLDSKPSGQTEAAVQQAKHYVIYLSGIGAFTGSSIPKEELPFLEELDRTLPDTRVIYDVFPYSVNNVGLTRNRLFSRFWRSVEALRPENPTSTWLYLVVVRNLFQVLVSADNRYGPVYNLAIAEEIWETLLIHGYEPNQGIPVTLMGTSGGGQISVGASRFLKLAVDGPVNVISLGGVISSDPGIRELDSLNHLYGSNDGTQALGWKVFPGRWPMFPASHWNQAKQAGKIQFIELGPCNHTGPGSPFDQEAKIPDGTSYFDNTLSIVIDLLKSFQINK